MSERNQCDVNASGRIHMDCTRDQYEASETEQLRARVAELERERDEALRLAYIGEHRFPDLTWKARCEEAVSDLRDAQRRVAELEAALRSARSELAVLASYVDDPAAEWPNAGLRMTAKAHAREVKRIDAALSGTASALDALIADAVRAEREACAEVCEAISRRRDQEYERHLDPMDNGAAGAAEDCADAIRARGES